MKDLPDLTLCAVDCINPVLALRALDISMQQCRFGGAVFLSDSADQYELPGCRMVSIPRIRSRAEYSHLMLKDLGRHFATSHVLVIQWDGYVINGATWRPEFLQYDYIGAPWAFHSDDHRIGNGGFSLRSRRLLDALQDPQVADLDPEDDAIGRRYRDLLETRYGIRFPNEDLARAFSLESMPPIGPPFGFHGLMNMWMVLPPAQLAEFVATLAPSSVQGPPMLRLGENYLQLKRADEAMLVLRRRLAVVPDDAQAQRMLAQAEAMVASRASASPPSSAERENTLLSAAMRRHQAGNLDAAEAGYREVLRLNADNAIARQYLGVLRMQHGDACGGETLIREAIAAMPGMPDFHNNLGLALRHQGRQGEAVAAYRQALTLKPDFAAALNNLGLDIQALGNVGAAIESFEQAVAVEPEFAEAHWNLGLARLTLGEFAVGWAEYEWRLRCQEFKDSLTLSHVAPWQGQSIDGKTILVRREQGAGDTLQFLRFIPELRRRGARVLLDVADELVALAGTVDPGVELIHEAPWTAADYYVNLMSLPYWLAITGENLAAGTPYITADEGQMATWRGRLAAYDGLRVGLVWAGNPKHKNDHNRSCSLALLEPLLAMPGVSWFSLQKGPAVRQREDLARSNLIDLAPELATFADTAAVLASLDLLITVDTSVAHLAGALGRPAWVMLPFAPDWRWLLERSDSPWYGEMRLFRQQAIGDWPRVVEQLHAALEIVRDGAERHRVTA